MSDEFRFEKYVEQGALAIHTRWNEDEPDSAEPWEAYSEVAKNDLRAQSRAVLMAVGESIWGEGFIFPDLNSSKKKKYAVYENNSLSVVEVEATSYDIKSQTLTFSDENGTVAVFCAWHKFQRVSIEENSTPESTPILVR